MAPYLGLSVAKPLPQCTDSGCGVSAARAQLIWNPDAALAGNSGGRACSTSVKLQLFLADFISQLCPLPFYCNPHSQVFDGKTQNRASQLLQTVVTLIFLSFSFSSFHYFPLFRGLLSACSLLCCSSSASHQRDTVMPMEKCLYEYISSPCLQECVSE